MEELCILDRKGNKIRKGNIDILYYDYYIKHLLISANIQLFPICN